jgi:hypothetical protein
VVLAPLAPLPGVKKKAGVEEHVDMFLHAGLLSNEPPGRAGLSFT